MSVTPMLETYKKEIVTLNQKLVGHPTLTCNTNTANMGISNKKTGRNRLQHKTTTRNTLSNFKCP